MGRIHRPSTKLSLRQIAAWSNAPSAKPVLSEFTIRSAAWRLTRCRPDLLYRSVTPTPWRGCGEPSVCCPPPGDLAPALLLDRQRDMIFIEMRAGAPESKRRPPGLKMDVASGLP